MLPSPADSGRNGRGGAVPSAVDAGLLAAPVAEALDLAPEPSARLAGCVCPRPAAASSGRCRSIGPAPRPRAQLLPRGRRGPGPARRPGARRHHDGQRAGREHAARPGQRGVQRQPAAGGQRHPRVLALPARRGARTEVVCKIFDSEPGWSVDALEQPGKAPLEQVGGRGLQVVAALSAGQWGGHPSRGRLGAWKVPGKAVWFALRVPPGGRDRPLRPPRARSRAGR